MSQLEPHDVGPHVGGDRAVTPDDRHLVRNVLDAAWREGRLSPAEHARRSQMAAGAVTFDDLIPLTRDLSGLDPPDATARWPVARVPAAPGDGDGHATVAAVFSGFTRQGPWTAPGHSTALAVFGGGKLDLTAAVWASPVIEVTVTAIFGGVDIIVPAGTEVVNDVVAVLGASGLPATSGPPNGRRLVVKGMSVFGGVGIKTA